MNYSAEGREGEKIGGLRKLFAINCLDKLLVSVNLTSGFFSHERSI